MRPPCVVLSPKEKLGIVVLTNAEPLGLPEAVCYAFLNYVQNRDLAPGVPRGQTLGRWMEAAGKMMEAAMAPPPDPGYTQLRSLPTREASAYRGTYEHTYYGRVTVQERAGGGLDLLLGPGGVKTAALRPWDGDTFVYPTIGENAVGLSSVAFDPTKQIVTIGNLAVRPGPEDDARGEVCRLHEEGRVTATTPQPEWPQSTMVQQAAPTSGPGRAAPASGRSIERFQVGLPTGSSDCARGWSPVGQPLDLAERPVSPCRSMRLRLG